MLDYIIVTGGCPRCGKEPKKEITADLDSVGDVGRDACGLVYMSVPGKDLVCEDCRKKDHLKVIEWQRQLLS